MATLEEPNDAGALVALEAPPADDEPDAGPLDPLDGGRDDVPAPLDDPPLLPTRSRTTHERPP